MRPTKPNRFRISSNFPIIKFVICILTVSIIINIGTSISNNAIASETIFLLGVELLVAVALFYFIRTRKQIDYDDIAQILYLVDKNNLAETQIPVERLDKILYSGIGLQSKGSYVIFYRDSYNQLAKFHLFPILFDNSIATIIADTKFKNPNLITRTWSLGWLNLFFKQ